MPSKQLPASIRYLKARLQILQRPAVWVSASVLLLAIVFLAETWKHPERFAAPNLPSSNRSTSDSESGSESAEAPVRPAPLDPFSSVEENPFGTAAQNSEAQPPFSTEDANSGQSDRLPSPLLLPRPSASRSSSSSVPDPFAAVRTAPDSTPDSAPDSASRSLPSSGSEESTTNPYSTGTSAPQNPFADNPSDASSSPNPLQSAIDRSRSSPPAQPSPSSSPFNSFSSDTDSTGMTQSPELQTPAALPGQVSGQSSFVQPQPLPGQPSYGQTQPQPQFIPQTSPAPGTTGYTMPPAFRTNANTPAGPSFGNYNNSYNNNSYNNNPSGVPSTVLPSTTQPTTSNPTVQPQVSQPQPQASPDPFSIPRAVPGRSIGGGQINTFSNP